MSPPDLELIRRLLAAHAARFCGVEEVSRILRGNPAEHLDTLRGHLTAHDETPGCGERRLFSAIALAIAGDAAGLEVLRSPGRSFMTSSSVEVALAQTARVLLGDLRPPLRFINAPLLGDLARAVGHPGAAPAPD